MPLQPCPECQTLVSESALLCPKCGRPYPARKRANRNAETVGGLVVLGIGLAMLAIGASLRLGPEMMLPCGLLMVIGTAIFKKAVNRKD